MNIRNRKQYERGLADLQVLDRTLENMPEPVLQARADALAAAIESFEIYSQGKVPPSPVDAILAAIAHGGFSKKDFEKLVGGKSVASRILNGKRKLTEWMMLRLYHEWNIPLEFLTGAARAEYITKRFGVDFNLAIEHTYDSPQDLAAAFA